VVLVEDELGPRHRLRHDRSPGGEAEPTGRAVRLQARPRRGAHSGPARVPSGSP
jgi:hypothetical protein